jgi:hypothetical protein
MDEIAQKWVRLKWARIRASQQKADEANSHWHRANNFINRQIEATDEQRLRSGQNPMTDLMKAQVKSDSLPLKEALALGKWHSDEAVRHLMDLQVFLKMEEMGVRI